MFAAADSMWMARALRLAEHGLYGTSPNPRVGCVLVKDGEMAGGRWHAQAGDPHGEGHGLHMAGSKAHGPTAHGPLEACTPHRSSPPRPGATIAAGCARRALRGSISASPGTIRPTSPGESSGRAGWTCW